MEGFAERTECYTKRVIELYECSKLGRGEGLWGKGLGGKEKNSCNDRT